jgi:hypothetical protein
VTKAKRWLAVAAGAALLGGTLILNSTVLDFTDLFWPNEVTVQPSGTWSYDPDQGRVFCPAGLSDIRCGA